MEEQILLRLPQDLATQINRLLQSQDNLDSIQPKIIFTGSGTQKRDIQLQYNNNQALYGTLCDLPTTIETYKSTHNTVHYKSCDISQIAVFDIEKQNNNNTNKNNVDILPNTVQYNHGITPITQSIRTSRYQHSAAPPRNLVQNVESRIEDIRNGTVHETYELIEEFIDVTDDEADVTEPTDPVQHSTQQHSTQHSIQATPTLHSDSDSVQSSVVHSEVDNTPQVSELRSVEPHSISNTPLLHSPTIYQPNEFNINTNTSELVDDHMLFDNVTDEYMQPQQQSAEQIEIQTLEQKCRDLQHEINSNVNRILQQRLQTELQQTQQLIQQKRLLYGL